MNNPAAVLKTTVTSSHITVMLSIGTATADSIAHNLFAKN